MKRIILSLVALAMMMPLWAKQIGQAEAEQIAKRFSRESSILKSQSRENAMELAYKAESNGNDLYYVFNNGANQGYVIVSADDCVRDVLGYSEIGTFDINNVSESMKWWLDQYAQEIEYAIANGMEWAPVQSVDRKPVKTLVSARWNQADPYNLLCPDYSEGRKCVTGCVATAMAQVMYYHKWPETGTGSNSYTLDINGTTKTLSADFGAITFDWANMTDRYNSKSSEASKHAVAQLMSACGISVNMSYALASGTQTSRVVDALIKYFDYDRSTRFLSREGYESDEWEEMIYSELAAKRPVMFSGQSSGGGHCFVCDGYSQDGYYHFNWGWGGQSDGYFLLTALNPGSQGIGGSSTNDGFNSDQGIIIGIRKQAGTTERFAQICAYGGFVPATNYVSATSTSSVVFNFDNPADQRYGFGSNCHADTKIALLLAITNTETNEVKYYDVKTKTFDNSKYSYGSYNSIYLYSNGQYAANAKDLLSLPAGTYKLEPYIKSKDSDEYIKVRIPSGGSRYVTMVSNNGLTFTKEEVGSARLKVQDLIFSSKLYADKEFELVAELQSENSEYLNDVMVSLNSGEGRFAMQVYCSDPVRVAVPTTSTRTLKVRGKLTGITAGDYTLKFVNADDLMFHSMVVTIESAPTDAPVMAAKDVTFGDNTKVNSEDMELTANLECSLGYFGGDVAPYIYKKSDKTYVGAIDAQNIIMDAGKTKTVKFYGALALEKGVEYGVDLVAMPTEGDDFVIPTDVKFTIADPSGIETIVKDVLEHKGVVSVYDVQGRKLYSADAENFDINDVEASGVLIVRSAAGTQKVVKQ